MTTIENNAFIENVSPKNFETTMNFLIEGINKNSWKISNVYDLQKTMEKNGKKVLPINVISLCQPEHSGRILESDSDRIISSMMPCRISVYEKENGKTYISRMNSTIMASNLGGVAEKVIKNSAEEVEEIIVNTLTRL
jgi:uncharacterized protein (DUF302 family)